MRRTSIAVIVLASVIAFFAVFAVWAKRQLLETETWTRTSTELLADHDVQQALNGFLIDQLFAKVDVEKKLEKALPDEVKGLAGPASGGIHQLATRAGLDALQNPNVQALWADANRRAHRLFLSLIHGGTDTLSTTNGVVTLDLGNLVTEIGQNAGIDVSDKLPPGSAQIELLRSNQLTFVQNMVNLLEDLALALPALALALYALAIYLARGWRREAVRACGISFIAVGILVLVARSIAGGAVVDTLAKTDAVQPAVGSVWTIGTSLLRGEGLAMIGYGIVILIWAWLAGNTAPARELRREITPVLGERRWGYAILAVIVLIIFWWNPTEGTGRLLPSLVLVALLIAAYEALRHRALGDFPGETWDVAVERWKGRHARIRGSIRRRREAPEKAQEAIASDARLEALERLGRLRESGVLEADEFRREKDRILAT
ncbi:MAG: SHOCT domain-containing protein [Solirubrobacterales bacterium]